MMNKEKNNDKFAPKPELVLAECRKDIDLVDAEIARLLGVRVKIVKRVAKLKNDYNFSVVQSNRVQQVLDNARANAVKNGLDPEFVHGIFVNCIAYAHEVEFQYMDSLKQAKD